MTGIRAENLKNISLYASGLIRLLRWHMAEKLIEAGGYKKDNEILSGQIHELIEDNKKLAKRIEELETKKSFFQKLNELFK